MSLGAHRAWGAFLRALSVAVFAGFICAGYYLLADKLQSATIPIPEPIPVAVSSDAATNPPITVEVTPDTKDTIISTPCLHIDNKQPNLTETLKAFNWRPLEEFVQANPQVVPPRELFEPYLAAITPFVEREPEIPARVLRRPWPYDIRCNDSRFAGVLTGEPRDAPVKVWDFFMFAFELDLLEVRLRELGDIVHRFILHEGMFTHRFAQKELFFARNQHRPRFAEFRDRIIYVVSDDTVGKYFRSQPIKPGSHPTHWVDYPQRNMAWDKFIKTHGDEVAEDDIFIIGDLDEIPDGNVVAHLKHCKLRQAGVRAESTFYSMNFDHSVTGYTMVPNPGFINVSQISYAYAANNGRIAMAGAHMNRMFTMVQLMYKNVALAEQQLPIALHVLKDPSIMEPYAQKGLLATTVPDDWAQIAPEGYIPWFANCNRERYPHWFPLRKGNRWTSEDGTRLITDNC